MSLAADRLLPAGPVTRSDGPAVAVATVAHVLLIAALSLGWQWASRPLPMVSEITPVDFVEIADVPRVTEAPQPSMEAAPQESATPDPTPEPEEAAAEPPPPPDAVPEPKPKPTPPKPAPAPKPLDTAALSNLINKALPKAQVKPLDTSELAKSIQAAQPKGAKIDPRAAATLAQAIRAQVAPCWNPPIGGADVRKMTVIIGVEYLPDGSVSGNPKVVRQTGVSGQNGDFARAFAETARRAVLRCQPLKLPADLYPEWRSVEINFDPEMMT